MLDRALDALIDKLERQKFAATRKPRRERSETRSSQSRPRGRGIPAEVKRAVWVRDGGRCTFVAESGRRCPARAFLEFDHVDEVARGGLATVERMRVRCRAHNQYQAERSFGADFMDRKRKEARRVREQARAAPKQRAENAAQRAEAAAGYLVDSSPSPAGNGIGAPA